MSRGFLCRRGNLYLRRQEQGQSCNQKRKPRISCKQETKTQSFWQGCPNQERRQPRQKRSCCYPKLSQQIIASKKRSPLRWWSHLCNHRLIDGQKGSRF